MANRADPEYRKAAEEFYRLNVERLKHVSTLQGDYGKWLSATIAAIHSAALYAIATNAKFAVSPAPFAVGLALILFSVLFIWINWSLAIRLFENWTDPFMLVDDARWPTVTPFFKWSIPITMYSALFFGVASAACIFWGCWPVLHLN